VPIYITEFSSPSPIAPLAGAQPQAALQGQTRSDCSESLFDIERAAEYIGMSAKWLYKHYADLPHIRIGYGQKPRIKFRRCDLEAWVREHRIE